MRTDVQTSSGNRGQASPTPGTETRGTGAPAAPSATYRRYHLPAEFAPDVVRHPHRFRVRVRKPRLAGLLLRELLHYGPRPKVLLSRPCIYGVFSGPVGGFAPREHLCVGCLRCTTEYPEVVQIERNPEHEALGDGYVRPEWVDAVVYEARTGRIPVRGAGYRGPFGGPGWDGMWTDMSEIVRPTRDGIHGREWISTVVDVGSRPPFLEFDASGEPRGPLPKVVTLPLPLLFDVPAPSARLDRVVVSTAEAARVAGTLAVLPPDAIARCPDPGPHLAPLVRGTERDALAALGFPPRVVELADADAAAVREVEAAYPDAVVALRLSLGPEPGRAVRELVDAGVRVFHLVTDYHGRTADGRFVMDALLEVHDTLVAARCRDGVTLLGSGGIVLAEHVPKAILCGLDAVALDVAAYLALQARMEGECRDRESSRFAFPPFDPAWGARRLVNLLAAWRDQLLEVLGAMGMREVRRLRGERGRAMFQRDLEREAFSGIPGYDGDA